MFLDLTFYVFFVCKPIGFDSLCKYLFFVHWNSFWYRRNNIPNVYHTIFFFFYKNEDDFPVIEDTDSRSSVTLSGSNNTKSNEVSTQMSKDDQ